MQKKSFAAISTALAAALMISTGSPLMPPMPLTAPK